LGVEAELFSFCDSIEWFGFIKARVQDHTRRLEDGLIGKSHFVSLLDSALGPANQELRLALHPEVRRIVRQVRKDRNERAAWKGGSEAFPEGTVKMRNYRDHHVRLGLEPEAFEQAHGRIVIQTYDTLEEPHELRAAKCPAVPEHFVIQLLDSNAGELTEDIQGVKYFLKVYEGDFERKALMLDFNLQGGGGVAMPSAGVKENKGDSALAGPWAGHSVCHLG
jgi:hypothetical protein